MVSRNLERANENDVFKMTALESKLMVSNKPKWNIQNKQFNFQNISSNNPGREAMNVQFGIELL